MLALPAPHDVSFLMIANEEHLRYWGAKTFAARRNIAASGLRSPISSEIRMQPARDQP